MNIQYHGFNFSNLQNAPTVQQGYLIRQVV